MNKMSVLGLITGGLAVVVILPVAPMVLYGLDQSNRSKEKTKEEMIQLGNLDTTDSLIGIDKNKNDIRDSLEETIDKEMNLPVFQNYAKRYVQAYQRSMDIQHFNESERMRIQQDLANFKGCQPYLIKYFEYGSNYDNNKYPKDMMSITLNNWFIVNMQNHTAEVFLNTSNREKAKKASDQFMKKMFKPQSIWGGTKDDIVRTRICLDFFDKEL